MLTNSFQDFGYMTETSGYMTETSALLFVFVSSPVTGLALILLFSKIRGLVPC